MQNESFVFEDYKSFKLGKVYQLDPNYFPYTSKSRYYLKEKVGEEIDARELCILHSFVDEFSETYKTVPVSHIFGLRFIEVDN